MLAILLCPPVAGAIGLGLGSGLAVGLSSGAGVGSVLSFGLFAYITTQPEAPSLFSVTPSI